MFADLAFAIDSIPAAFAITRDPYIIWMGNVFALLGLRALFVLVEGLIARFRYLDETIAIVLGLVAVKLLTEDLYKVGPLPSLAVIALAFTIGIVLSDPGGPAGGGHAEAKRRPTEHRVQRQQLHALEPVRLAVLHDHVGDQHGEQQRRPARSR